MDWVATGGHTVPDLLKRVDKDVLARKPTVVVIQIGCNDARRIPKKLFRASLVELIDKLQTARVQVIQCSLTSVGEKHDGTNQDDPKLDEFAQVEHPLQRRFKGTGLGLPLSKRLAELLGGRIWVESEAGVGSTFFAEIPIVYRAVLNEVDPVVASWAIDPARIPVLVVEDAFEEQLFYEKILKNSPYQLFGARTIAAARKPSPKRSSAPGSTLVVKNVAVSLTRRAAVALVSAPVIAIGSAEYLFMNVAKNAPRIANGAMCA